MLGPLSFRPRVGLVRSSVSLCANAVRQGETGEIRPANGFQGPAGEGPAADPSSWPAAVTRWWSRAIQAAACRLQLGKTCDKSLSPSWPPETGTPSTRQGTGL